MYREKCRKLNTCPEKTVWRVVFSHQQSAFKVGDILTIAKEDTSNFPTFALVKDPKVRGFFCLDFIEPLEIVPPQPQPQEAPTPQKKGIKVKLKKKKEVLPLDYSIYAHGVTQSMVGTFRQCPAQWLYKTRKLRSFGSTSGAISFGNIYHDAQEHILGAIRDGLTESELDDSVFSEIFELIENTQKKKMQSPEEIENFEMAMLLAEQTIPLYFEHWKEIYFGEDRLEILALEQEFNVPDMFEVNGKKIPLRGKFDGVLRDSSGKIWLLEHKSKAQFDEDALIMCIPRDVQVLMYMRAIEHVYGEKAVGVIYNVTRRSALRYAKTKETLKAFGERVKADILDRRDWYFRKFTITISEEEVDWGYQQVCKSVAQMAEIWEATEEFELERLTKAPEVPQFVHSCQTVYGACPYLKFCSTGGRDQIGLEIGERIFSELSCG